jgi:site-specific DNA recombinase
VTLRAVIYARFSSDKQRDRSIQDQVALCRGFCERDGLSVVGVYEDRAISGASMANRLGWQRVMRDARAAKFDVVVAEALDRISRDQEDLAGIYKRLRFCKIEIRTVQDGTAEEIHVGIKGLLGALYLKDLAQKTKRGQAGVIRDGRHNGGRSFGYRPVPGEPGRLEILPDEAAVVRRIFASYVAGQSPRDIAGALNREGIRAPRGGCWNASTIGGSRTRQNGILQNRLYIGQTVWNRQTFIKNPENGRRVSRPNPPSDWMDSKTPELRIIDDTTWNAVQHRRAKRGGATRHHASRPRRLLSGLLKCGKCGSGYVVSGADKRGPYLRCSRLLESGACDNKRTVSLDAIEATVLHGIESHLCAPELVAEYVKEFHRAMTDLRDTSQGRRAELSKRLVEVEKAINAIVDAIAEGGRSSRALTQRLADLESERDVIETTIKEAVPPPIALRPDATETYREKVKDLKAALNAADQENRTMAYEAIRELIDEVVIRPHGPYKPVEIDIYGRIQSLFPKNETDPGSMGVLVALDLLLTAQISPTPG